MDLLVISAGTNVTKPEAGDQVRAWNIIEGLHKNGWKISILEKHGGDSDVEGVDVTNFKHITPARLNDFNPFLYLTLMDQFRWKAPDIVHVVSFAGVIAAKAVSIVTKQSTSVVYDAQNFETGKIQKASGGLPWYKSVAAPYLIPALESIAVRIADHVVAVNDEDRKAFEDELSVPEDKLSVIPSGSNIVDRENADVSNFLSRHNLPDNELILIFHGWYGYYPNEEAVRAIIRQSRSEAAGSGVRL